MNNENIYALPLGRQTIKGTITAVVKRDFQGYFVPPSIYLKTDDGYEIQITAPTPQGRYAIVVGQRLTIKATVTSCENTSLFGFYEQWTNSARHPKFISAEPMNENEKDMNK